MTALSIINPNARAALAAAQNAIRDKERRIEALAQAVKDADEKAQAAQDGSLDRDRLDQAAWAAGRQLERAKADLPVLHAALAEAEHNALAVQYLDAERSRRELAAEAAADDALIAAQDKIIQDAQAIRDAALARKKQRDMNFDGIRRQMEQMTRDYDPANRGALPNATTEFLDSEKM